MIVTAQMMLISQREERIAINVHQAKQYPVSAAWRLNA